MSPLKGGGVHQLLVPYDILTDRERKRYRRLTHELIRYLQYWGYRLSCKQTNQQPDNSAKPGAPANPNSATANVMNQFAGERGEGAYVCTVLIGRCAQTSQIAV